MSATRKRSQRETLLYYWNEGIRNVQELYAKTNIPIRTIRDNVKKLKKKGTIAHARNNGRPKKITADISRMLCQYIRHNSSISVRTMVTKLAKKGIVVSYSTISRHLAKIGYKNSFPRKVPMLTESHKQARVEWARKHLNDNWRRTFFSDETAFQLFRNTIKVWYKGKRPVRHIPKDRTKLKAWGGFWSGGKSSLFCFKETMNAEFYVGILREHIPEVKAMLGNRFRWQQDNDPKHTSRLAMGFLQKNVPEIIDWPSCSPDLNPLENIWSIVKRNVESRMPKNLGQLEQFMSEEWNAIPKSLLEKLVGSMRQRCELVIKENGETISY